MIASILCYLIYLIIMCSSHMDVQLRLSTPKGSGIRDRTLESPQAIDKNVLPSPAHYVESSPLSIIVFPSSEVLDIFQGYFCTRG